MGLFEFFGMKDMNEKVKEYESTQGALLLDVRTPEEYREGHLPESINLPLQDIHKAGTVVKEKNIPVFVYCHSGTRSEQAAIILRRMGYASVTNMGGIISYKGKVVV